MATTATAQAYQALLAPPDYASSEKLALTTIEARYTSWDHYISSAEQDGVLEDAKARAEQLQAQVGNHLAMPETYA
jgi:hypothetical protein